MQSHKNTVPVVTRMSREGKECLAEIADSDFGGNLNALVRDALIDKYPSFGQFESSERITWNPLLPPVTATETLACDVPLTGDEHAIVSQIDYTCVMQWKWQFGAGRARRTVEGGKRYLEREIAERAMPGVVIKRILFADGNRLNCQRNNLRVEVKGLEVDGQETKLQQAGDTE